MFNVSKCVFTHYIGAYKFFFRLHCDSLIPVFEITHRFAAIIRISQVDEFCTMLKSTLNTPIFGKAKCGLKLKVIISSFNFRVLWFPKSVASYF